jgi:hypothetical protein
VCTSNFSEPKINRIFQEIFFSAEICPILKALDVDNIGIRDMKKWYFVSKIVLTYCEKKCSINQEKLLRSLVKFIQTLKGKTDF